MLVVPILGLVAASAAGVRAFCHHNTHLYDSTPLLKRSDATATYGYEGVKGPLNWNLLSSVNFLCANGTTQSPINLNSSITSEPGSGYVLAYPDLLEEAEFEHLGTTVEVVASSFLATLSFAGKVYNLQQFHFHAPGEHHINAEFFPLEVHFVHQSADNSLAVVGFVIEIGFDIDPLLSQVLSRVDSIPSPGNKTHVGPLTFRALTNTLACNPVYRYTGSLTTPPCAEGIEWIVSQAPLTIDVPTFNAVKKVLKFNSRYTQNSPGQINLLENACGGL